MNKKAHAKQYEQKGIYSLHDLEAFIDQDVVKNSLEKDTNTIAMYG